MNWQELAEAISKIMFEEQKDDVTIFHNGELIKLKEVKLIKSKMLEEYPTVKANSMNDEEFYTLSTGHE